MEECIEKSVCKESVCVKALTFGCLQAFSLVCAGRCKILVASGFIPGIKYTQQPKVRPQKSPKAMALHAPQIPCEIFTV
jgi:hypothetical protein